jgi:predicted O-linked N-acetylglucosamine transferase (SPINDLY family)
MWMGAPVISLAGKAHASRVGASLLSAVGHPDFCASTPEEFVEIAARLTSDLKALAALRASLRGQMHKSVLCDEIGFTRKFETVFETLIKEG